MIAESKNDPVACRVPVTQEAMGVWELICQAGCDTEPELVQDAMNKYREYLQTNPPWYFQMNPTNEFVFEWFTVMARYGSPRMRRFRIDHPKFVDYIALVKRAMERG
jgi:hypothetical protein